MFDAERRRAAYPRRAWARSICERLGPCWSEACPRRHSVRRYLRQLTRPLRGQASLQRLRQKQSVATPPFPVGAYEQREAAIGCAAVVVIPDSPSLPALRTESRASALPRVRLREMFDAERRRAAYPRRAWARSIGERLGPYWSEARCRNAAIPCRSVRAARGRDRLRSSRGNSGFTLVASASH
jgi:hypothetical protein